MNFLKKKIKNVVHGKRNKDDDDDDFDNYVPAVPPHPSTLDGNGNSQPTEASFASFNSTLTSITSVADSTVKSIENTIASSIKDSFEQNSQEDTSATPQLSLEELKAKEEEHKQLEKAKLKEQEEAKKDREDWKYFLSLTAKVDAVTSQTKSVLDKLKDDSAVNEISQVEDPCFLDKYDESAPKTAGTWIAFEEQQELNPADPILTQQQQEPSEPEPVEPVIDENTQRLAKELIEDFGFTNPAPGIPLVDSELLSSVEADTSIDPFDTSFIDVEAIKSGKSLEAKSTLIRDFDNDNQYIDPFDTSHLESIISTDLVIDTSQSKSEENK